MIPIMIDGAKYALRFSHSKFDHAKVKAIVNNEFVEIVPRRRRETTCAIVRISDTGVAEDRIVGYDIVATGKSSCSPEDNFSKETGRTQALFDALRRAKKSDDPVFKVHDARSASHFHAVEDQVWSQYDTRYTIRSHYKEVAA